jgi:hypothetical protein
MLISGVPLRRLGAGVGKIGAPRPLARFLAVLRAEAVSFVSLRVGVML